MKPKKIKPTSEFSRRFSEAFKSLTKDAGVTQMALRQELGRTQSYISERMRGVRPVETDMIDAAARMMKIHPRDLVRRVLQLASDATGQVGDPINTRQRRKVVGQSSSDVPRNSGTGQ